MSSTAAFIFPDQKVSNPVIGLRNRIGNGNMVIDQRNVGTAVSASDGAFLVDRWRSYNSLTNIPTVQQTALTTASTPPQISAAPQFNYAMVWKNNATVTTNTALYNTIQQVVEGSAMNDLQWGTAAAKKVTVSFWVYATIAGISTIAIRNYNGGSPSYCTPYTIAAANTWQYVTLTIPGPQIGTWVTDTNGAIQLLFGLHGSTNTSFVCSAANYNQWIAGSSAIIGATATNFAAIANSVVAITGVQLELGTVATPFEWRPLEMEMRMCQRYYEKSCSYSTPPLSNETNGSVVATFISTFYLTGNKLAVEKRIIPTIRLWNSQSGTVAAGQVNTFLGATIVAAVVGQVSTKAYTYVNNGNGQFASGTMYQYHYDANSEF